MNLPLATSASIGLSIHIPAWILGGFGFAAALTLGMALAANLLTEGSAWIGFGDTASIGRVLAASFVIYGLVPGLAGSAAWFCLNWWLGLIIGGVTFAVVYYAHLLLYQTYEKRQLKKRSQIVPRFRMEK